MATELVRRDPHSRLSAVCEDLRRELGNVAVFVADPSGRALGCSLAARRCFGPHGRIPHYELLSKELFRGPGEPPPARFDRRVAAIASAMADGRWQCAVTERLHPARAALVVLTKRGEGSIERATDLLPIYRLRALHAMRLEFADEPGLWSTVRSIPMSLAELRSNAIEAMARQVRHRRRPDDGRFYLAGDLKVFPLRDVKLSPMRRRGIALEDAEEEVMKMAYRQEGLVEGQWSCMRELTDDLAVAGVGSELISAIVCEIEEGWKLRSSSSGLSKLVLFGEAGVHADAVNVEPRDDTIPPPPPAWDEAGMVQYLLRRGRYRLLSELETCERLSAEPRCLTLVSVLLPRRDDELRICLRMPEDLFKFVPSEVADRLSQLPAPGRMNALFVVTGGGDRSFFHRTIDLPQPPS